MIPLLVAVLLSASTAAAQAPDPYVVYTANREVDGAVILRTDPATGSLVEISRNGPQGTLFHQVMDLAVEADGNLLVVDMGVPNRADGALIRVDPLTGRQTLVSSGGAFFDPAGIAIGPGGAVYVLDNQSGANNGAVIRVDPATGHQVKIVSNEDFPLGLGPFDLPFGIAVEPSGSIVVVNRGLSGALPELGCALPSGSVLRVVPGSHVETLSGLLSVLSRPLGVAVDLDGDLVVANECRLLDPAGAGLLRIDPVTGPATAAGNSTADVLVTPERVAVDPAGDYLVTDFNLGPDRDGGIVHVARGSQAQSVLSTGALFNHPMGIAVVRNRPPTAALAVGAPAVAAGRPVSLDASGSRDPEGLRLVYEWDLDGDGSFEAGSGTTPAAAPRFATDGVKTVRVRVTDPHGGRAVAQGSLRVDGSMPVITGLRVARVLGLRTRPRRAASIQRATPPQTTQLRFRLSEAARVTAAVDRARAGRRRKGRPCRTRAKRGRRCTIYSRARTITRSATAGENAIRLRARGLRPGAYRITVSAVDAVGNRSASRRLRFRVVRVR